MIKILIILLIFILGWCFVGLIYVLVEWIKALHDAALSDKEVK